MPAPPDEAFGEPLTPGELKVGQTFGARTSWRDGIAWVALSGELDVFATPRLRAELREVQEVDFELIVLDLRGLSFMDSTGLAVILGAHERAQSQRWRLKLLIRGSYAVESLFEMIGAEGLLDVIESPADVMPIANGADR